MKSEYRDARRARLEGCSDQLEEDVRVEECGARCTYGTLRRGCGGSLEACWASCQACRVIWRCCCVSRQPRCRSTPSDVSLSARGLCHMQSIEACQVAMLRSAFNTLERRELSSFQPSARHKLLNAFLSLQDHTERCYAYIISLSCPFTSDPLSDRAHHPAAAADPA